VTLPVELLADENVETEWVRALRDDGHDVVRVVDIEELGVSATDPNVLTAAARRDRVLLTADQSDFSDPPTDAHPGIIIVADVTRTGGEVRRAVRRIERSVSSLSGHIAYVSDWL
jgi:predicted nuclease of predicted toxin-antitoxin system